MRSAECGVCRIPHSAFEMAARVGLAPTPCGLTNRHATLTPPGNLKLALPAGVAPASVRLEDERLVYFGHGSPRKWSDGMVDLWIVGKHRLGDPIVQQSNNPTIQ